MAAGAKRLKHLLRTLYKVIHIGLELGDAHQPTPDPYLFVQNFYQRTHDLNPSSQFSLGLALRYQPQSKKCQQTAGVVKKFDQVFQKEVLPPKCKKRKS